MKAVRFNPKVTFGLTAVVVTVCVTLATLLTTYLSGFFMSELRDTLSITYDDGSSGSEDLGGDALVLMALTQYATMPFLAIATPLLTGLLIVAVSKAVLGQKVSVGQVVGSRRIWAVLGFSLLLFFGMLTVFVAFVVLVVLVSSGGAGAVLLFVVVGGLALTAGWLWLTVRTLLVPPALMLEGEGFWPTVARAWRLTHGSFWRLLGIYLLVVLILGVLTSLVSYPLTMLAFFLSAVSTMAALAVNAVTLVLMSTITTAFEAVVVALLYLDVRMRREGLDLELARAASEASAP